MMDSPSMSLHRTWMWCTRYRCCCCCCCMFLQLECLRILPDSGPRAFTEAFTSTGSRQRWSVSEQVVLYTLCSNSSSLNTLRHIASRPTASYGGPVHELDQRHCAHCSQTLRVEGATRRLEALSAPELQYPVISQAAMIFLFAHQSSDVLVAERFLSSPPCPDSSLARWLLARSLARSFPSGSSSTL